MGWLSRISSLHFQGHRAGTGSAGYPHRVAVMLVGGRHVAKAFQQKHILLVRARVLLQRSLDQIAAHNNYVVTADSHV